MILTEHGKELLWVEVVIAPLALGVPLGIRHVVEGRLSTKRVDDSQETAEFIHTKT